MKILKTSTYTPARVSNPHVQISHFCPYCLIPNVAKIATAPVAKKKAVVRPLYSTLLRSRQRSAGGGSSPCSLASICLVSFLCSSLPLRQAGDSPCSLRPSGVGSSWKKLPAKANKHEQISTVQFRFLDIAAWFCVDQEDNRG